MLLSFKNFILKEKLFNREQRVLLAISGGLDSVVMSRLFHLSGFHFGIAHCNFGLRGKESDQDELFVKKLASEYDIEYHINRFHIDKRDDKTCLPVDLNGASVQMAARELRYEWFEKLRLTHGYDYIAIAHHKYDETETVLINLVRGTGIAGLHGILPKHGKIVRPMLFSGRKEIEAYASKEQIDYREDSSNKSLDYVRNKIRLKVIPVLKDINPNIEETFSQNVVRIRDMEEIYQQSIESAKQKLLVHEKRQTTISIDELRKLKPLNTYLFEILKPWGFNGSTVKDIIESLDAEPGKRFHSPTHQLLKDRDKLIITETLNNDHKELLIEQDLTRISTPLKLKMRTNMRNGFQIPTTETVACLDYHKLHFPLVLRKWEAGDYFHPLGMKTKKKLSDFFIDNKLSRNEKDNTFVLVSGKDITWIVGQRIDNRYKVADNTEKIYLAELIED